MHFWGKAQNIVCLLLAALWTGLMAISAVIGFLVSQKWGHRIHRLWGQGWLWLMDVQVDVYHMERLPKDGAYIIAPNHESMIDILVMSSLPLLYKYISKEQVGKVPVLGWAMKAMGTFFVKRNNPEHDLNVMKDVEDGLRSGLNVLIFPEGTRTRTGELLPFKKGAFKTAQNAGVPLCPVAITGTYAIAPPGVLPSHRGHRVKVRFGFPFSVSPNQSISESMDLFRKELVQLLEESRVP